MTVNENRFHANPNRVMNLLKMNYIGRQIKVQQVNIDEKQKQL